MLTFKDVAKIFVEIELMLISSLKRNLKRHKIEEQKEGFEWSAWQTEKLKDLENFRRENAAIMSDYSDVCDSMTRQLMSEQFEEGERLAEQQARQMQAATEMATSLPENYAEQAKSETNATSEENYSVTQTNMDKNGVDRTEQEGVKQSDSVTPKPKSDETHLFSNVTEQLTTEPKPKNDLSQPQFFGVNEKKMTTLIEDIVALEKTVQTAALRMTDDVYRQTVNRVQLAMGAGSMTLNQAIDMAARDFLDKGINCIYYADGRRVNIADYVRMALRTTSTRATLQGQAKRWTELGYDTVMTSQYGMCSKTCEPWQGQVYIDDVYTEWSGERDGDYGVSNYCGKRFPLLSTAIRAGLFHPNCRHTLLQYIDGVTKIPDPIPAEKIKAQRELEQKQRAMERKIRKLKRLAEGTLDEQAAKEYRKKLKAAQRELKEFIGENEGVLRRDYSREKNYGGLTDKEKDDIIKAEIRKIGFRGDIYLSPKMPDFSTISINSEHISEREHNVTLDEAVEYIRSSKVMIAKWNGTVYNYYSEKGASYLHPLRNNTIHTAFSANEYDDNTKALMEVLKKYGV